MRTVYKYPVDVAHDIGHSIPVGAILRGASARLDGVDLWYEVDTDKPKVLKAFYISGTGMEVGEDDVWVATARHEPSGLVWHVWQPGL